MTGTVHHRKGSGLASPIRSTAARRVRAVLKVRFFFCPDFRHDARAIQELHCRTWPGGRDQRYWSAATGPPSHSRPTSSAADWTPARSASKLLRILSPCVTTTQPAAVGSSPRYLRRKRRLPRVFSNSVSRWLAPDKDRLAFRAAADRVPLRAHRTTSLSDTSSYRARLSELIAVTRTTLPSSAADPERPPREVHSSGPGLAS
jgi:hypothetical protein